MVEENPRVGRRMKSDPERLEEKDSGGGGKGKKKSVRRLGKILCEKNGKRKKKGDDILCKIILGSPNS